MFLGRGDHLKRRPLGSETEQAPAGGRCPEEGGLALRQVEGLGQGRKRLRMLPQKNLHRGVGEHGATDVALQGVSYVLGDGG